VGLNAYEKFSMRALIDDYLQIKRKSGTLQATMNTALVLLVLLLAMALELTWLMRCHTSSVVLLLLLLH
jgi:hypothetical protein